MLEGEIADDFSDVYSLLSVKGFLNSEFSVFENSKFTQELS